MTGILDVDYKLGPAAGRNLANGAELLASVRSKSLESYFNFFLHDVSPQRQYPDDELVATFASIRRNQLGVEIRILSERDLFPKPGGTRTPFAKAGMLSHAPTALAVCGKNAGC